VRWLSGRKRRFAKPLYGLKTCTQGSNPCLTATFALRMWPVRPGFRHAPARLTARWQRGSNPCPGRIPSPILPRMSPINRHAPARPPGREFLPRPHRSQHETESHASELKFGPTTSGRRRCVADRRPRDPRSSASVRGCLRSSGTRRRCVLRNYVVARSTASRVFRGTRCAVLQ
jgi:hypothetical protein